MLFGWLSDEKIATFLLLLCPWVVCHFRFCLFELMENVIRYSCGSQSEDVCGLFLSIERRKVVQISNLNGPSSLRRSCRSTKLSAPPTRGIGGRTYWTGLRHRGNETGGREHFRTGQENNHRFSSSSTPTHSGYIFLESISDLRTGVPNTILYTILPTRCLWLEFTTNVFNKIIITGTGTEITLSP